MCFSSGQEVQRISVITTLPDLLKENNADCMRRVVPKVRVSTTVNIATYTMTVKFNVPNEHCTGTQCHPLDLGTYLILGTCVKANLLPSWLPSLSFLSRTSTQSSTVPPLLSWPLGTLDPSLGDQGTYTYNLNFILKLLTNHLCLCFRCLQVISNQRVSAKPVKYHFVWHTSNAAILKLTFFTQHTPASTFVSVLARLAQI